ncbi:MAG: PIN domain-containing protein [Halobacteria archaeon]
MGYLIDTSVLVAASVEKHDDRKAAIALLGRLREPKIVDTVVVAEYAHVVRRLTGSEASASLVADLCRAYDYYPVPISTILGAMPHFRHGVGDALIGQHAIENGWKLVTLDRGFRRFVPENLLVTR